MEKRYATFAHGTTTRTLAIVGGAVTNYAQYVARTSQTI
jgi:hypothetical protein